MEVLKCNLLCPNCHPIADERPFLSATNGVANAVVPSPSPGSLPETAPPAPDYDVEFVSVSLRHNQSTTRAWPLVRKTIEIARSHSPGKPTSTCVLADRRSADQPPLGKPRQTHHDETKRPWQPRNVEHTRLDSKFSCHSASPARPAPRWTLWHRDLSQPRRHPPSRPPDDVQIGAHISHRASQRVACALRCVQSDAPFAGPF